MQPCYSKILYPDKFRTSLRTMRISEELLAANSYEELMAAKWMPNTVVTFVYHMQFEDVIKGFELVKIFDGCEIRNPLDDLIKVQIKVNAIRHFTDIIIYYYSYYYFVKN